MANPHGICTTCFTSFHQQTQTTVLGANQSAIPHTNAQCPHQLAGFVVGGGSQLVMVGGSAWPNPPKQCKICNRTNHRTRDCWFSSQAQGGRTQLVPVGAMQVARGAQGIIGGPPTKPCKICSRTNHRTRDCWFSSQAQGGGAQLIPVGAMQVARGAQGGGGIASLSSNGATITYKGRQYPVVKIDLVHGKTEVEFVHPNLVRQRITL
jgi:hypothetical protein